MDIFCLKTGDYETNTYILAESGKTIIIDPGFDAQKIVDKLDSIKCTPEYVLVTHGHFDHIGAVAELRRRGARVHVPAADYAILDKTDFGFGLVGKDTVEPFEADTTVNDEDTIAILGHVFKVITTPGHTPGSVCYVMDDKFIFSGDTLFRLGIGRTDLAYSVPEAMDGSISKLFALGGDYEVYPGHGKPSTLNFERKYNPYA